jgi:hypothetical protein
VDAASCKKLGKKIGIAREEDRNLKENVGEGKRRGEPFRFVFRRRKQHDYFYD